LVLKTEDKIENVGVYGMDNRISLIRVAQGCTAKFYRSVGFKGEQGTSSIDIYLPGRNLLNDRIKSISCTCKPVPPNSKVCATAFEHDGTHDREKSLVLKPEDKVANVGLYGLTNRISFIRVAQGCSTEFYKDIGFKGEQGASSVDIWLPQGAISHLHDKIKSISCTCKPKEVCATAFEHGRHNRGRRLVLKSGDRIENVGVYGMGKAITFIRVAHGCTTKFYKGKGFKGEQGTSSIDIDLPKGKMAHWNDKIESISCTCKPKGPVPSPSPPSITTGNQGGYGSAPTKKSCRGSKLDCHFLPTNKEGEEFTVDNYYDCFKKCCTHPKCKSFDFGAKWGNGFNCGIQYITQKVKKLVAAKNCQWSYTELITS